jgi:hypothetical protein
MACAGATASGFNKKTKDPLEAATPILQARPKPILSCRAIIVTDGNLSFTLDRVPSLESLSTTKTSRSDMSTKGARQALMNELELWVTMMMEQDFGLPKISFMDPDLINFSYEGNNQPLYNNLPFSRIPHCWALGYAQPGCHTQVKLFAM